MLGQSALDHARRDHTPRLGLHVELFTDFLKVPQFAGIGCRWFCRSRSLEAYGFEGFKTLYKSAATASIPFFVFEP